MTIAASPVAPSPPGQRLLSLDFMRGFIMVVLMLGETEIFAKLNQAVHQPFSQLLATQFSHSKWDGSLHFWDLLQPAFMFLAGTSLAFSYRKQKEVLHRSWHQSLGKVLRRSVWLLFWGLMINAVKGSRLNLQFSNVLVMLAFTTLLTFLIINWSAKWQLVVSLLCLLIPELLFRFTHIPGYDQPFTDQHNFADWIDLMVLRKPVGNYSPIFNALPTAAHTIWGLMAGNLLLRSATPKSAVRLLWAWGAVALASGSLLCLTGITPMMKWIGSSSYVLVTGGVSLVVLAICYDWIDARQHRRFLTFFTVVGMNSVFIYIFYNIVGSGWLYRYVTTLGSGWLQLVSVSAASSAVVACLVVFGLEWFLCYFLYQRKIFFKL